MLATNHNSPPVYENARMQFRHEVIQFMDNKIDVLIGHTIEFLMDDNGHCNASIKEIMQCSKIKKEETVTKSLERIAEKIGLFIEKRKGKRNKYFAPFALGKPELTTKKAPPLKEGTPPESTPLKSRYFKQEGRSAYAIRVSQLRNKGVAPTDEPILEPILEPIRGGGCSDNNHQRARENAPPPQQNIFENEVKTVATWLWLQTLEGHHGDKSGPKELQFQQATEFIQSNSELYTPEIIKRAIMTTKSKRATRDITGNPLNYVMKLLVAYQHDEKIRAEQFKKEVGNGESEAVRKMKAIVGSKK